MKKSIKQIAIENDCSTVEALRIQKYENKQRRVQEVQKKMHR